MDRWVEVMEQKLWPGGDSCIRVFLNMDSGQKVKGQRTDHDVGDCLSAKPPSPLSHFSSFCSLIYSGLRWHRGLDSACCQTKAPQCSQYYSDPVSALSPMRSPQCYVSLTEKYSHTEKDAILQGEALLY